MSNWMVVIPGGILLEVSNETANRARCLSIQSWLDFMKVYCHDDGLYICSSQTISTLKPMAEASDSLFSNINCPDACSGAQIQDSKRAILR